MRNFYKIERSNLEPLPQGIVILLGSPNKSGGLLQNSTFPILFDLFIIVETL